MYKGGDSPIAGVEVCLYDKNQRFTVSPKGLICDNWGRNTTDMFTDEDYVPSCDYPDDLLYHNNFFDDTI